MNRINLTIIFPSDPLGEKVGGAETFINGLIKYAPEDIDVDFIGVSSKPEGEKKYFKSKLGRKPFNYLPILFNENENKRKIIPLSLRFTRALKKYNLEYSKKILFYNRIEPAILYSQLKIPQICIVHNDIEKQILRKGSEVFWRYVPSIYFYLEKKIFSGMDNVYTVSMNSMAFYEKKYPGMSKKIKFLPTYVDDEIFYATPESKLIIRNQIVQTQGRIPIDCTWILFVGRLQEQKAPIRLIDAFFEYSKRDQYAVLIIIGEGNLREKTQIYTDKLGLENKIFFIGTLDSKDIASFYRAADLLLLVSNFEGMPICVLEALNCGLPVVSTRVGEVERVVKDSLSGEVVKTFSPKDIAISMEKVLGNKDVYSKTNCVNLVSEYTPEKVLAPLYERIRMLYKEKYKESEFQSEKL